jgi:uncharacterized SAM-binding protein YcdF (DUF218 family)
MWGLLLWVLVGAGALSIVASELWHRTASRSGPGKVAPATAGSCAVVVLGFPARRNGDLHALQRWRTEIGIRSLGSAPDRRLVFTGGPTRGAQVSEARVMADYARRRGVPAEGIVLEEAATNTWENLLLTTPLVEAFDTIVIASDPVHASRSRRYLVKQRPDLGMRLVFADDYRPLERWWLKLPTAAYELTIAARDRLRPGRASRAAAQSSGGASTASGSHQSGSGSTSGCRCIRCWRRSSGFAARCAQYGQGSPSGTLVSSQECADLALLPREAEGYSR